MSNNIQHFHVQLFSSNSEGNPATYPKFDKQGDSQDKLPQYIVVDGYSQDQMIDLQPYWDDLIPQGVTHYETVITIKETIIKFGDTMQLVDHYLLIIDISYGFLGRLFSRIKKL